MDARQPRRDGRKARPGAGAAVVVLSVLSVLPVAAWAAERVALVIGNGDYAHVPFLATPGNDARAVGDAFERMGYFVTRAENAGHDALRRNLRDFKRAASASEMAVVFYAGHGIEVDKNNYLVPVDAKLAHVDEVTYEAVPLDWVMDAVGGAGRLGMVILDACRDNPFVQSMQRSGATRSIGQGLARVTPSGVTLVAYAAEDGKTAKDGDGTHSPYTGALLRYLDEPGLDVERMFDKVRAEVERSTGGSQTPTEYGAPLEDVYLASGAARSPPPQDTAASASGGSSGDAERAYKQAERLGTVAGYRALIRRYPGSIWAELARVQIAELEKEPQVVVGGVSEDDEAASAKPLPEEVENGLGLSGGEKRLVQMGLAAAGYSPGLVDGVFGGRTRKALRAWQESKEVEGTGYLTREQSEGLVALGREESERRRVEAEERHRAEAEREAREAEERRRAEAERKEREAEERRRAEAERKEREAEERRRAEAERKAREAEERRRAEAERKEREAEERRRAEAERKAREAEERRARTPGYKFQDCPQCPKMVVVPGGQFGRPFAVGVYEVTFMEWDACVSGGGCGGHRPDDKGWGRGRRPVIHVNWKDAKAYVRWLSRKAGEAYRLLSDAEWEYVARAGTVTRYWWGDDIGRNRANCIGCRSRWDFFRTAPVGSFSANAFGLYDVHGNVWEWVEDCYTREDCSQRVLRGGSFRTLPWNLRSAFRFKYSAKFRDVINGFRVARTLTP